MEIRPCNLTDLPILCDISKSTFIESFKHLNDETEFEKYINEAFTVEKIEKELQNPHSKFFFAHEKENIVGYLKVNFAPAQSDVNDENSLEVERIYVKKMAHGKKIGHHLLQLAMEIAKKYNKKYIWLGVWEKNEKAILFYEQHGFQCFDKHVFMVGTDAQTDFLFKLEL